MFKVGSFETELAKSMADNLANNTEARKKEVVKTAQMVKSTQIEKAINHLSSAAELFDGCGLVSTSEVLTKIIEKLGNKQEPEMFEFESLLKDEEKEAEELGEQIIEMRSLFDNDSGKKKH